MRSRRALARRIEELERRLDESSDDDGGADPLPMSRRGLLRAAGAAAAGAVVAGAATPARAADPNDVVLGVSGQNAGPLQTGITMSNLTPTDATLRLDQTGAAKGLIVVANTDIAILAMSTGHVGVSGASANGVGVQGLSTNNAAVQGSSTNSDSLAALAPTANTAGAQLKLAPGSIAGPPTGGAHTLGQFWVDTNGVLFQCVVAGSPGKWVRQSSLVALASPFRIYDSRGGQPNPSGSAQGTLNFGAGARPINCTPTPNPTGVNLPATTPAILFNVTLANTVGGVGSVVVWAMGASEPAATSIVWTGSGVVVGSAVTSGCDASQDVQIKCTTGSGTHVILDVIGFYI